MRKQKTKGFKSGHTGTKWMRLSLRNDEEDVAKDNVRKGKKIDSARCTVLSLSLYTRESPPRDQVEGYSHPCKIHKTRKRIGYLEDIMGRSGVVVEGGLLRRTEGVKREPGGGGSSGGSSGGGGGSSSWCR